MVMRPIEDLLIKSLPQAVHASRDMLSFRRAPSGTVTPTIGCVGLTGIPLHRPHFEPSCAGSYLRLSAGSILPAIISASHVQASAWTAASPLFTPLFIHHVPVTFSIVQFQYFQSSFCSQGNRPYVYNANVLLIAEDCLQYRAWILCCPYAPNILQGLSG
jgi:hypothetical protein